MRHWLLTKPRSLQASVFNNRLKIVVIIIICLSLLLIVRLAHLQVFQFSRYQTLSLKNQIGIIPIGPPRGIIVDRKGVVLADNIPMYVLEIIPERVIRLKNTLSALQALLPSISEEDTENFLRLRRQHRAFEPIPLKLKLTQEEVALFVNHQYRFPGVTIKAQLMRYYPLGKATAHILGYLGRINLEEWHHIDATNYRATNFIGKSGIEKFYESLLHGKVGYQQIETDVSGRTVRVLNKRPPVSGTKLILTLDARLQQAAYKALADKRGAIVVLNPHNGDVLAMASAPGFDPNIFVNGIPAKAYQALTIDPTRPLYNRAVRGLYPPASTIKPFIGLIGLEKEAINTDYRIYDPGWFKLPKVKHLYRDWKRSGHGMMNLKRAITVSCDTYFFQLGHRMGISALEAMLAKFGFGQSLQIDLYEEAKGLIPNSQWKRKTRGQAWYPGDTVITSIGQGFMLTTPLQLAHAVATISLQGKRYRPHLLKSTVDNHGKIIESPVIEEYPIQLKNNQYWQIIIDAMTSVITSNEGTGYRFGRNAPYPVAAKTGTAQVFSLKQNEKRRNEDIPELLRDHSLFIAFAPVNNPKVAIATVVENDVLASNVARQVLDAYFQLEDNDNQSHEDFK